MKRYKELQTENPENFKRLTGLAKEKFEQLCNKVDIYIKEEP
ncbi:MAG: hypothetical protein QM489_01235 [Candidatus Izemoplasma sp.]